MDLGIATAEHQIQQWCATCTIATQATQPMDFPFSMGGYAETYNFKKCFNTGKEGLVTVVPFSCSEGCNYISGANKNISTPCKFQHCFVLFWPQLKPCCILHSSSNLHGWQKRSSRPADHWTNVCSVAPEWLVDAISEVLNSPNLPCFAWTIRKLSDRCL